MTAVYAGSFDPPTMGHVWMIREGARIFDQLVVAVGENPDKKCAFDLDQRLAWLCEIAGEVAGGLPGNIQVVSFCNQFLVNYARSIGAATILRGIRNENDYTYERAMRHINADLQGDITTVFLMPPRELCEISSSAVKGMVGPEGWREAVQAYLPACVFTHMEQTYES